MAIPASKIVSVTPRVIQAGGTDLVINGLFLTENDLIPTSSIAMSFSDADSVGAYFGLTSHEYEAALVYFKGYNNSFKKPREVYFARRVASAVAGYLRGATFTGKLADLQKVTDGSVKVTVDGTAYTADSVDFSSATSLSDCASLLATALADSKAAVTYSSLSQSFQVTSSTSGASSSVSYAEDGEDGTGLATLLCLSEAKGAVLSTGSAAQTVTENMSAIRAVTENWVTFTNLYEPDDDSELLALAQWSNDQQVEYLFVCHSTDAALTNQSDTSSIAKQISNAELSGVTMVFGGMEHAAFIMGTAASIDWERRNGAINFAFKRQDGIAASVTDTTIASVLLAKKVNVYGTYATRNDSFTWLYDGNMFGDYGFIDPFVNAIWLNSAIQLACMQGLEQSPRVPYNDDGYTLIRAWIMDPIARAKKNGVIDPGVELSESQKAELFREAGMDITPYLTTDGYYLQIEDAGASVRVNRESPNISLWYTYGGSVNRLEIASTLIL